MKSGILGLLLLFTAASSYAQLKCDSPDYADNPAMHDACVNMEKALEEKIKEKMENFSEGINKARSRISEARLQQAAGNAPAATAAPGGNALPGVAPPTSTVPVQQAPPVNYPTQTEPAAPQTGAPPAPVTVAPPETAPSKVQNPQPPTKSTPYY